MPRQRNVQLTSCRAASICTAESSTAVSGAAAPPLPPPLLLPRPLQAAQVSVRLCGIATLLLLLGWRRAGACGWPGCTGARLVAAVRTRMATGAAIGKLSNDVSALVGMWRRLQLPIDGCMGLGGLPGACCAC